ncbi:MAG TPA: DUF5681 domain-containing protein [Chthoniobacterales bacterium]
MARRQKVSTDLVQQQPAEIMNRLLLEEVDLTIGGVTRRVTALEAIMMQLFHQQMAGNTRAYALLTQFRRFLPRNESVEIEFETADVES